MGLLGFARFNPYKRHLEKPTPFPPLDLNLGLLSPGGRGGVRGRGRRFKGTDALQERGMGVVEPNIKGMGP